MRNNRPKSENPAMKEHAAQDKDAIARERTTEAERAAAHPHRREPAADKRSHTLRRTRGSP
jgi:hypothetical protein